MLALTATALIASGCVNPTFRESTAKFGELTKTTVAAQNEQLTAVAADEQESIRAQLASERADLRVPGECAQRLHQAATGGEPRECELRRRQQDGQLVNIPQAPRYAHILALGAALQAYADSLTALAADQGQSEQAFTASLNHVATTIGGIDHTIRSLSGEPQEDLSAKLNAVAGLIARAGNLYFNWQRNRMLKQIIIAADPFVQRAVDILTGVDQRTQIYLASPLYTRLQQAQDRASQAAANSNATIAQVRTAQDALFDALAAYNRQSAEIRRFRAIGEAHKALREAAEANASPAELLHAIQALIELAGVAHDTATALHPSQGSNGHAN